MWSMALMVVIIGLSSCAAGLVGGMVGGGAAYNKNKLAASQSQEKVVPKLSPEDQRLYDHYFLDAMVERQKGNSDAAFDVIVMLLSTCCVIALILILMLQRHIIILLSIIVL